VAEKIRETIASTAIEGAQKKVTISAGVATLGQDGNNSAELIGKADQAVYQAKRDGRFGCACRASYLDTHLDILAALNPVIAPHGSALALSTGRKPFLST